MIEACYKVEFTDSHGANIGGYLQAVVLYSFITISSREQEFIYDYCQGDAKDKFNMCNKQ